MKEIKTKYCAIKYADNGSCEQVLECKNLTEKEYAKLKNEEIANHQEELKKDECVDKRLTNLESFLTHNNLLIAKSLYDNFVDRGIVEDDKGFQNKWFDYVINGGTFNVDESPELFKKVLSFVCRGKE